MLLSSLKSGISGRPREGTKTTFTLHGELPPGWELA